jgi:hypothetical protein
MLIRRRIRKEKWCYQCRKKRLLLEKSVSGIKKHRKREVSNTLTFTPFEQVDGGISRKFGGAG